MSNVFLTALNMSVTAGWIVLAVTVLRQLLKKAPKSITCTLWALVGIRLVCPFSFESVLSLIPSAETVSLGGSHSGTVSVNSGVEAINQAVNPVISEMTATKSNISITTILAAVWIAGILGMILYSAISYMKIYRNVKVSVKLKENIYICDYISTPFVLGIIKPKIYLPSLMNVNQTEYVIAHEKAHLKRRDNWWKPIGFAVLSVYWFNPLMWLAYILLCRDIELACDERVIKDMKPDDKKAYSEALFACSAPKRMVMACPVAFAEVGVKTRIKSVLNYKKPAFWIVIVACAAIIVTAVCFLTNQPTGVKIETKLDNFVSQAILDRYKTRQTDNIFSCESHIVLQKDQSVEPEIDLYCVTLYSKFRYDKNADLEPMLDKWELKYAVITVNKESDGSYTLNDYRESDDSCVFPEDIRYNSKNYTFDFGEMREECRQKAYDYFKPGKDPVPPTDTDANDKTYIVFSDPPPSKPYF